MPDCGSFHSNSFVHSTHITYTVNCRELRTFVCDFLECVIVNVQFKNLKL